MKRGRKIVGIALIAGFGAAFGLALIPGARAEDAKLQVTTPAWKGYQDYLAQMGANRHGFFAISKDGQIWGNAGCPKGQCPTDDVLKASAIQRCQQFSAGTPCLIFAEDRNTLIPYAVKDYTQFGK